MARARKFYDTVLGISMQDMSDLTNASTQMVDFGSQSEDMVYGLSGALVQMEGVTMV